MENSKNNLQKYKRVTDASEGSKIEIKRARSKAALSVCINLLLASAKGASGVIGGSSALLADAIHSATDVIASAATCFGLWLAGKEHPSFPYGLYKAETLATLFTSVVVILAGYEIARSAFLGPETIPNLALVLPVVVFPLVVMVRVSTHCHQSDQLCRLTPVMAPNGAIGVHLAKAPWFCVETVERDSNEISGREYVQNPYWNAETKRGFLVGKWLLTFKPDQLFVAIEKEGTASALLKEAGVEVVLVEESDVGKKAEW